MWLVETEAEIISNHSESSAMYCQYSERRVHGVEGSPEFPRGG